MVFGIPYFYFYDFVGCDGVDYQYTFWENGFIGSYDSFWHIDYNDKSWIQSAIPDTKMDQHEFSFDDWVKLNFE